MDKMLESFILAKKKYDAGKDACDEIKLTAMACIENLKLLKREEWSGPHKKLYSIYSAEKNLSRPFLTNKIISTEDFEILWDSLLKSADIERNIFTMPEDDVTKTLYNAIVPFCICFDLWKPKSRKTPGTFFEIVLGTILGKIIPDTAVRTKHIQLPPELIQVVNGIVAETKLQEIPDEELSLVNEADDANNSEESDDSEVSKGELSQVATDIVFDFFGKGGIVIPAKITTRERIVQPFAHQRILDGVFGEGRYISLITCVSETQRSDKNKRVNEITVPGTIALFQKHLAKVGGIYYLDPPDRYLTLTRNKIVPVYSVGELLTGGFAHIIKNLILIENPQVPAKDSMRG